MPVSIGATTENARHSSDDSRPIDSDLVFSLGEYANAKKIALTRRVAISRTESNLVDDASSTNSASYGSAIFNGSMFVKSI